MLAARFRIPVQLRNPGPPRRDVDDTTDLPGAPELTDSTAELWQLDVGQRVVAGDVVLADWGGMFPPGDPIGEGTEVRETPDGPWLRVYGQPRLQRSLLSNAPDHISARLKYISDTQGATP